MRSSLQGGQGLLKALQILASFSCPQGTVCSGLEGLCLLIKRSTYPCCYFDLSSTFGRLVPELCMIANTVLDLVFNKHGFRLTTWNQPFLTLACKRVHVLKCQSTALPNCLIENRYGPIRVHNMMQGCSKTLACCKRLKDKLTVQGGGPMSLWGPNLPTSSSFTGPLPNRGGPSTYSRYGSILCSNEFC